MRDLFYLELRARCEEIRQQEQAGNAAEESEALAKTVLYLVGLQTKARKYGLLTLEDEIEREIEQAKTMEQAEIAQTGAVQTESIQAETIRSKLGQAAAHAVKRFFLPMVRLVVDGTDPEVIEKICMAEYFSAGFVGYEGVRYLFFYAAAIEIQNGTHPMVMEEILTAMLPESCKTVYQRFRNEVRPRLEAEAWDSSERNICADGILSQADINRLLAEKASLIIPSVFIK
ncbi:MAG: hypothetical protein IJ794_16480 [Lachnospiraceae bacterium]|nr:hypothetical protein [Lachnospiraceae bacterium]